MNVRGVWLAIGFAAVALSIAFAIGRYTAPTKTVEKIKTVEVVKEVAAKQKEETSATSASAAERTIIKWKIREVRNPDGTLVRTAESETDSGRESATKREEAKREAEIRYVDRKVEVEKIKIVEVEKAQWGLGVRGGYSFNGAQVYGGFVERRLVSRLWVGAYATTAKEVGAQLRIEW